MIRWRHLLVVVGMLFSAAAYAQNAEIVENIVVGNNQRVEDSTVLSYITIAEGKPYDSEQASYSIKRLFETGLFSDVAITRDGTTVMVYVQENPIVNQVDFEGNKRIKDDQLLQETNLDSRSVYTRARVQADVKRIMDLYKQRGRYAVSVSPQVVALDDNRVDLVYEIDEGHKAVVKKIIFVGNDYYDDKRLKKELNTKESSWLSFYSSNDAFDPNKVAFDKELLRKFYFSKGFADFKVISSVSEITSDKQSFIITFMIDEGQRYQIGAVDIDSQFKDVRKEELQSVLKTQPDTRFDERLVDESIDQVTERLSDLGYAFVDVNTEYERDVDNGILNITYRIKEGPRVYINRINVAGNVRTLDKVIRREFRLSEGDPFNAAKIKRSRQRIQNLGFFEDVKVDSKRSDEPDKADIHVEVQERSTGELNFGAGYSTTDGTLGNVSIRERNLLGKGQDLRLSIQRSSRGGSVDLGFTEPYFMGRDIAAGFDLFDITRDYGDESSYDSKTQGGTLRATYSLTEHLRHTLRYSIRDVTIEDVASTASIYVQAQEGQRLTSLIGHSLMYDRRDDAFSPTEGYFIRFNQDLAGLGGDSKYVKHEVKTGNYYPVYREDVVFMLGVKAGHIFGYGDEDVAINERFFIGGTTIRGFDTSGIGPRDDGDTNDALGGNTYYAATGELTFPLGLPDELGVKGKAFVDAGTLYDVDETGSGVLDESSIRASVGAGIIWSSPMGPIGITYAHPFAKESFDDTKQLDFNFGTRF